MRTAYPRKQKGKLIKIPAKPHAVTIQYFIRKADNTLVRVCAKFFSNITGASINRLALIARYYSEKSNIVLILYVL